MPTPSTAPMPVGFVAHGAPTLALDAARGADFRRWGEALPTPRAILVLSAHWLAAPLRLGQTAGGRIVHDFRGFPRPLYELGYDAPGAPELARRVEGLLEGEWALQRDDGRPMDHGVWVPLLHMRPAADVPVLQLSMPQRWPREKLVALGRALRPLRDEGVLLLGSGNLTHNLRRVDFADRGEAPPSWASELDAWASEAIRARDVDALVDAEARAPAFATNHPTDEHYRPLLVAMGASDEGDAPSFPVTGWEYGSLTRRSVQLG